MGVVLRCHIRSSKQIHSNYVDCVRWLGECVLSKSVDNRVILWRPDLSKKQSNKNSLENVEYLQVISDRELPCYAFSPADRFPTSVVFVAQDTTDCQRNQRSDS